MINIFERGDFSVYRSNDIHLAHLRAVTAEAYRTKSFSYDSKKTVFLSHKHSDLTELQGIIGFLEQNYNVQIYIDSQDPSMPNKTCGETAARIKDIIRSSDKFILMATNDAIESKWCNWELGFGDSIKFPKNLAIFPIKNRNQSDSDYKGNEYLQLYPHIVKVGIKETYKSGNPIKPGYYVATNENGNTYITPLDEWLNR